MACGGLSRALRARRSRQERACAEWEALQESKPPSQIPTMRFPFSAGAFLPRKATPVPSTNQFSLRSLWHLSVSAVCFFK